MDNPPPSTTSRGINRAIASWVNVFTDATCRLSLNMPMSRRHDFVQAWRERLNALKLMPASWSRTVLSSTTNRLAIKLTSPTSPLWHTADGGNYLGTGDIVITRDPDTGWINRGTYRVQVHDPKTAGIMISPGKHGRFIRDKYWSRGQACPVAISMGHDPLLLPMGGLEIDHGTNEYDVAGGIRGEPVQLLAAPYTGLPVPASAEIVLEGDIRPRRCMKKARSESGRDTMPVANARCPSSVCARFSTGITPSSWAVCPANRPTTTLTFEVRCEPR